MLRPTSKIFTIPIVLATFALSGCINGDFDGFSASHREAIEKTLPFDDGDRLSLENVNGRVSIRTWPDASRNEVLVEAEKRASSEKKLDDINVEITETTSGIRIKTIYPKRSLFGSKGSVAYVITLPQSAEVEVETVNGRVDIEEIHGRVEASTVNGSIRLTDVSGSARARTVNGSVRASFDAVEPGSDHVYRTTNGSVKLSLPEDVSGSFEARTVNGRLQSDFPLDVSGKWGPKRMDGRLGNGEGSFEIKTVNGSVNIGKRS